LFATPTDVQVPDIATLPCDDFEVMLINAAQLAR
jgi:hypothetical protein